MREMWAISEGSYSDYRILALFDVQEEAEACAEWHNQLNPKGRDAWYVESFLCVAAGEPFMRPWWKVRATLTRSSASVELSQPGSWFDTKPPPARPQAYEWEQTTGWDWENRGGTYPLDEPQTVLEIEGADQQGIRQSFSDRCARYKAETGAVWPTPDLQWEAP